MAFPDLICICFCSHCVSFHVSLIRTIVLCSWSSQLLIIEVLAREKRDEHPFLDSSIAILEISVNACVIMGNKYSTQNFTASAAFSFCHSIPGRHKKQAVLPFLHKFLLHEEVYACAYIVTAIAWWLWWRTKTMYACACAVAFWTLSSGKPSHKKNCIGTTIYLCVAASRSVIWLLDCPTSRVSIPASLATLLRAVQVVWHSVTLTKHDKL